MVYFKISFFKYLLLKKIVDSFWIIQFKSYVTHIQFLILTTEVFKEVKLTKFEKRSVKVHFDLTYLFQVIVSFYSFLHLYFNFLRSILLKCIFNGSLKYFRDIYLIIASKNLRLPKSSVIDEFK